MFKKTSKDTEVIYEGRALPSLYITKTAINKMKVYIDECDKEIGWLGTVENMDNVYVIKDVMLFEQEVSATTTDIDEGDLSKFATETLQKYGNEKGIELLNSVKMWGHSHVNMSVFASGTDDSSMDMFGESGHDYFIRLIGNKKGDLKVDIYDYENGIQYQNLPFEVIVSEEEARLIEQIEMLESQLELLRENEIVSIEEQIKLEMNEKVRTKSYVTKYSGKTSYSKPKDIPAQSTYANIGYDSYGQGRYSYQQMYDVNQNTYRVGGLELLEDELWEIAGAKDSEECRVLLVEYGLYKNQSKKELEDIIDACDEALIYSI